MSEAEFTAFVRERWVPLVRSAVFLGCSQSDAEDVVQTCLTQAYRRWELVRQADDPTAYVSRMLLHTLRRSRERRWWGERPTAVLPEAGATDRTGAVDLRAELTDLLGRLSPEQREVLVLRYIADLTEAQTAVALDVPVGTVKSRTARALAACARLREEAR